MLFLFSLIYIYAKEEGYLYSRGQNMFLTYTKGSNGNMYLVDSEMPKIIRTDDKGSYKFVVLSEDPDGRVMDSGNDVSHPLHAWNKHGEINQRFNMERFDDNWFKFMVRGRCIEARGPHDIKEVECTDTSNNKNQYFRWIPLSRKDDVEKFIHQKAKIDFSSSKSPQEHYRESDTDSLFHHHHDSDNRRSQHLPRRRRTRKPEYKSREGRKSCDKIEDFEFYGSGASNEAELESLL